MTENIFMKVALEMAREAYNDGEVPVGAVIVKDNIIIAKGRNRREKEKNALLHAEIDAINNVSLIYGSVFVTANKSLPASSIKPERFCLWI